jgi:hypothetical protein
MAAVWTKPEFLGNPYKTVTAIDVSGGIAYDRVKGSTPFFFQVSAKNITATGTDDAWSDLEFRWVLRNQDGSAITHSDSFTDPSTGQTVDPLTDQFGPEACFVLRDAGIYWLTLHCRGKNGGSYTTANVSQSINVTAYTPSNTYYIDPVSGNNANPGTEGSPKADLTGLIADDTELLLKSGTTLNVSESLSIAGRARMRIGIYGGTSKATIQSSAGASGSYVMATHTSSQGNETQVFNWGDWVVSNIIFDANNVHTYTIGGTHGNYSDFVKYRNTYFDNCVFRNEATGGNHMVIQDATNAPDGRNGGIGSLGFWNCDLEKPTTLGRSRFFISLREPWRFYMGGKIEGYCENAVLDHHCYDSGDGSHRIFRWVAFGADSDNGNYCINWNAGSAAGSLVDCSIVDGCLARGTKFFCDASNSDNSSDGSKGEFDRVIWQFNAIDDSITNGDLFFYALTGKGTCRYNASWGARASGFFVTNSARGEFAVYGNFWYAATSGTNAFYARWDGDQLFKDNAIYSTSVSATTPYSLPWALSGGQSRDFDNNTLYLSAVPVIDDSDGIQTETWANWQSEGYDTGSTLTTDGTAPSWPDPANGEFASEMSAIPTPPTYDFSFLGFAAGGQSIFLQT